MEQQFSKQEGWDARAEEFSKVNGDKYHEAFGKFEPAGTNEEVAAQVQAILEKHASGNFTPDVLKTLHGVIDLTSLTSLDTKESIWKGLVRMCLILLPFACIHILWEPLNKH